MRNEYDIFYDKKRIMQEFPWILQFNGDFYFWDKILHKNCRKIQRAEKPDLEKGRIHGKHD